MLADRSRNVQALKKFKSFHHKHVDFFKILNYKLSQNDEYFSNEGKFHLQVVEHTQSCRYTTKQLCKRYNLNTTQYNVMFVYHKVSRTLIYITELSDREHYNFLPDNITYIFSCNRGDIKHKIRKNYVQMFERDTNLSIRVKNNQIMGRDFQIISNEVDKSGYNVLLKKNCLQEKLVYKDISIQTQYNRLLKIQSIFQQMFSKIIVLPENIESLHSFGYHYSNLFFYVQSAYRTIENVRFPILWNMHNKKQVNYLVKRMKYAISKARSTARNIVHDINWWNTTEEIKELAKQILEV